MRLHEVQKPTKSYLYESIFNKKEISTLTFEQLDVIKQVEDAVLPHIQEYQRQILTEAPISADRITDPQTGVFALATKTADDKGVNPGFLQKSAKAIGQSLPIQSLVAANKALNDLGGRIQSTKAITGFDTRVEKIKLQWAKKLRQTRGGVKLLDLINDVGAWGNENPGKQAFALGVLMVVGGVLGGPGGAAVAGYMLRATMDQAKQSATEVPAGTEVEDPEGTGTYTRGEGENANWTNNDTGDTVSGHAGSEKWDRLEAKARVDTGVGRLSTTAGKAAKTAIIGLVIGGITDAVGALADTMWPPEISDLFIATDGQSIDLSSLDAMNAASLEELGPEQIKELMQARNAMTTMVRTGSVQLNSEDMDTLQAGYSAINQKIRDLGGEQALLDAGDLAGTDVDLQQWTDKSVNYASDRPDIPDADSGSEFTKGYSVQGAGSDDPNWYDGPDDVDPVGDNDFASPTTGDPDVDPTATVAPPTPGPGDPLVDPTATAGPLPNKDWVYNSEDIVDTFSADELQAAGINFTIEPPLSDDMVTRMTEMGLDQEEINQIQQAFKIEKAFEDQKWMKTLLSTSKAAKLDTAGIDISMNDLGLDPNNIEVHQTFESSIEATLPGMDRPIEMLSRMSIDGIDENGEAVFAIKSVTIAPDSKMPWEAIVAKVGDTDEMWEMMSEYTGTVMSSQTSVEDLVNTVRNTIANGIGVVVTAAAVGGALAAGEVKGAKKEESFMPDLAEDFYNAELNEDWSDVISTVKTTGKLLGDKLLKVGSVSVNKLLKAWKKAGSPEDTDSLRNIMSDAGLDAEVIEKSITDAGGLGLEEPSRDAEAAKRDADTGDAEAGGEKSDVSVILGPDGKPLKKNPAATTGTIPADISMPDLAQMLIDAGLVNMTRNADTISYARNGELLGNKGNIGGVTNKELARLIASKDYEKENEMRVDEMCGGGCGDEMEMPKTNYNLSVTKDEGNTHKSMTVTSDQPDELIRVLQLSGMDTGHSEPDGDEIVGVDMDHDEPDSVSSMKDLISKVSHPPVGHDEAVEEVEEVDDVEQDHSSDAKTFGLKDLVIGQTKKQPRQRQVSARHGDNPYKDAGQLEEDYTAAYAEYKNEK